MLEILLSAGVPNAEEKLDALMQELDGNGDHKVSYNELLVAMERWNIPSPDEVLRERRPSDAVMQTHALTHGGTGGRRYG